MKFLSKLSFLFSPSFIIGLITFFLIIKIEAFKDFQTGKPIGSDVNFYYEYLPATFIYNDISLHFSDTVQNEVKGHIWYVSLPGDARLIKTTMGVAVFFAPAFFVTHYIVPFTEYEANGYSKPYHISILISALLFSLLALLILKKTLRRFFKDWVVSLTLITLVIGTNLFIYITTEPGMSHVYSFFLFCCFIELTISWYEKKTLWKTILLGIVFGLITLIRPTNLIIGVFFIFYEATNIQTLKNRFKYLANNYVSLLLIALITVICWIPQMLYWKHITGHYLYFSYLPGERFYFDRPRIILGLFSYRKGWLLYTPVMILAITGICFLWKKYRSLFWPFLIFLPLNIYIIFSWWCWWYGGSFSSRPMVDSYPLMALPLAAFISQFSSTWKPVLITIVLGGFIYFNQFQSHQYRSAAIHWDAMSKEAYWGTFGQIKQPENLNEMLAPIDYDAALRGEYKLLPKKNKAD